MVCRMKRLSILTWLIALLSALVPFEHVFSADPPEAASEPTASISTEKLEAKIKEVEATADLDEAMKKKLTELYRKTISHLEAERSNSGAAEAFSRARETAPEQAKEIRAELDEAEKAPPTVTESVTEETPLSEVEQQLLTEKANLAAVEAKLADLNEQLTVQADRPTAARQRLNEANQRKEELAQELKQQASEGELPALTEALRWRLETEGLALRAEIKMLDQELLSQPMRIELLKAQRDRTARSVRNVGEQVRLLEEMLNQRRRVEAEKAQEEAEQAQREAADKHPVIQQLAEENAVLSEKIKNLTEELERVTREKDSAIKTTKRIDEDFQNVRSKLEIAGLSQALGKVLMDQRRDLPESRVFRRNARKLQRLISDSGLRQIDLNNEREQMRDIDRYLEARTIDLPPQEIEMVRDELRGLIESRRQFLDKMIATDNTYIRELGELDFAQRRLLETIETYDGFLSERLLWVRTTPPPSLDSMRASVQQAARILSPAEWLETLEILALQFYELPLFILVLLVSLGLFWYRKRFYRMLEATGKNVGRPLSDRLAVTFRAIGLSVLLALPWPLVTLGLGWELRLVLGATDFTKGIGQSLFLLSPMYFYLRFFHVLCATKGVAEAHFGWPEYTLRPLRRALNGLMTTLLPAAFLASVVFDLRPLILGGFMGKVALIAVLGTLFFFFYRVLHPKSGILHHFLDQHKTLLVARTRLLWFTLVMAIPVVLAGLTLAGYVYTAAILTLSLAQTMWLIFGLVVIHQVAVRWLHMTSRRLAYEEALERRREERAEKEAEEAALPGSESLAIEVEKPEIDLVALSEESRKLIYTALVFTGIIGLWVIWSEVLPAFGVLDHIAIWYHTAVVEGQDKRVPITLADLVLGVLIAMVTLVAAKNLPALLEIILLKRLNVTSGGRYAITTLTNYALVAIGILVALGTIGFSWSQIQWLVAALSLGIGFGLQEIVANFISGLIILFEQPIRVGDVVTVGTTDGVVTRIRIRATTIRNWDRKELLVPNKQFITDQVVNWSLSDPITRIVVPVGVAYGTDIQKAMSLMAQVAEQNKYVLEDPAPSVNFELFGDNALTLNLRCFVGSLDYRLTTITALHTEIDRRFNDAGIVISFPQRDIHLDTSRPLELRIRRDDGSPNTGAKEPI